MSHPGCGAYLSLFSRPTSLGHASYDPDVSVPALGLSEDGSVASWTSLSLGSEVPVDPAPEESVIHPFVGGDCRRSDVLAA